MNSYTKTGQPGPHEIIFLALGGVGEIGMNLYLYGHDGAWLMVDLGVSFGEDYIPGIDGVMPDPSFIKERSSTLVGLVVTHGHEDHLGAIQHLWPQLGCPVYATGFPASLLRRKLNENGLDSVVPLKEIKSGSSLSIGPFDIKLITLTHSIPEPNGLVIRTKAGTVVHTGDWKFDKDPVIGRASDMAELRKIGDEGVLAMMCDSTNALVKGNSGSEGGLKEHLQHLISGCKNRVVVGCFASNVARFQTIAEAAENCGRHVVLLGRSLNRINQVARENGLFDHLAAFITEENSGYLPRDKVLFIATGSQGEPRAALARLARGDNREVGLDPGDNVIFSSRVIPGNEVAVARLQNQFIARGVDVFTDEDWKIHVSGHPTQEDLVKMYEYIRPQIAVPIHGEMRHLVGHGKLAKMCHVPHTAIAVNGTMVKLDTTGAHIIDHVETGRVGVDGSRLVSLDAAPMRERRRLQSSGIVFVSIVLGENRALALEPYVSSAGLIDEIVDEEILIDAEKRAGIAITSLRKKFMSNEEPIIEAVKREVRAVFRKAIGKKPIIKVHLLYK